MCIDVGVEAIRHFSDSSSPNALDGGGIETAALVRSAAAAGRQPQGQLEGAPRPAHAHARVEIVSIFLRRKPALMAICARDSDDETICNMGLLPTRSLDGGRSPNLATSEQPRARAPTEQDRAVPLLRVRD